MLDGLNLAPPLNKVIKRTTPLEIIYEDQHLLLVDKPENMLSVPGKIISESVFEVLQRKYGSKNDVFMVHRLDMATSGLLLVAKNLDVYKELQKQFAGRVIQKEYQAILEGIPDLDSGSIDLPLNLDHYDRPRQIVDFNNGKESLTYWKKLEVIGTTCRVSLIPYTGRTHQLRVHMAHHKGMGIPIKGDNLYGNIADRLYLHAKSLTFTHPVSQNLMEFNSHCPF
jgi:tRNA pseudouridine32 synthase/23S rRNA pseudouridine746 synthase